MPTYRIHHLTRYSYEDAVSVCHNLAHLLPRDSPGHVWRYADIEISPAPAVRAERLDYFGNRLTFFAIQEPHRELDVITRGTVELQPPAPQHPEPLFSSPPWELVRDRVNTPVKSAALSSNGQSAPHHFQNPDMLDAFQFTFASPYIRWLTSPNSPSHTSEIAAYAAQSFTPNRPILEAIADLTARIHTGFKYDTKSTTVSTTLPEIMAARAGVCQDFAHLQIGCLRSLGLAARYVSGYLLTAPPPGRPRLIGADASHAWLSIYLPDVEVAGGSGGGGWLNIDPTNNTFPSDKHITLAWGRDFGDVSPLRGVIHGGGKHRIHVSVDVSPIV